MTGKNNYTFYHVPSCDFPSLTGREAQHLLMQWSLKGRLHCQRFSFDEIFKHHDIEAFAKALFHDDSVRRSLENVEELPMDGCEVKVTPIPCTLTSMTLFDRCVGTVTHESGRIKSCFEDYCGPLVINDCLTRMLCVEDSEFYNLYDQKDREEFLFRLFKHIVIGGELVQPSEDFNVYTNFVKNLYKDLISVQKMQDSDDIVITSKVYKVQVLSNGLIVYPSAKEHTNNFAYLIVNPVKRHVIVLSHVYGIGQF
ncbi:unnamed protein product [Hymenolepis diminuta]|uniref:Cilia- and flagella-associated protein 300 n=1 Tax=Hymenolepis diminuta TaxID=6216 RepID=A0A564XUH8_HYMDI|nr:unnamed protein product [Hymenolepis diminuta]